jgi:DNA-binding Lrp family transcriptional regulator
MNELRKYETFKSVKQMDKFIGEALEVLPLSKIERDVLWLLAGHSCKVFGVSWLKVQTIADTLEVSYKTAQRALKRLKDFGIVKRVRTLRSVSGGFGASITIICPVDLSYREEAPEPSQSSIGAHKPKSETFLLKAFHKDLKELRHQAELDYTYLESFGVPKAFIETVKPFINVEEAYSLWGKVQVASKRHAPAVENIIEPAIRAFKASVMAYKMKRIKGSFGGYFFGALSGVFSVEQRKVNKINMMNWLES